MFKGMRAKKTILTQLLLHILPSVAKKNEKNDESIIDQSIVRSIVRSVDGSTANFKFQLARAGAGRLGRTERHGGAPALAN